MHMIGHDDSSVDHKSFTCLAVFETIDQYLSINSSCENVHPTDYCKSDKVDAVRISKFVLGAHMVVFVFILVCSF